MDLAGRLGTGLGLVVQGGQGLADGAAERDRGGQGRGEEDVAVLLAVFGRGRGVAAQLRGKAESGDGQTWPWMGWGGVIAMSPVGFPKKKTQEELVGSVRVQEELEVSQ